MKLSQLTLNGSFTSIEERRFVSNNETKDNNNIEGGYETPIKNNLHRFITNQQSASTLARTNSAGPKQFIKRVSKIKDINNNNNTNTT